MNTNLLILLALLADTSTPPAPWSLSNIKTDRPLQPNEAWCTCSRESFTEIDLPAGYRPLLKGELVCEGDEVKLVLSGWGKSTNHDTNNGKQSFDRLYRTTRPLPETDPYKVFRDAEAAGESIQHRYDSDPDKWYDIINPFYTKSAAYYRVKPKVEVNPYQEFQDAFDAGKVIQCRLAAESTWANIPGQPAFNLAPDCYRVKPWSLDDIKTSRELLPGEEWCTCEFQTFEESDLPVGYRPLLKGEQVLESDAVKYGRGEWVKSMNYTDKDPKQSTNYLYRTTRPLPPTPEEQTRTTRPLPPTPEEQTRKDFETWAKANGYSLTRASMHVGTTYYQTLSTRSAYEGYVAGQKSKQSS